MGLNAASALTGVMRVSALTGVLLRVGATEGVGYGLHPYELYDFNVISNELYYYKREGDTAYLWDKYGSSAGYTHSYETWSWPMHHPQWWASGPREDGKEVSAYFTLEWTTPGKGFGPMRTFTMVRRHIPHPVVYTMSTHAHLHDGETPHSSPGGLHDDRHGALCQEPPHEWTTPGKGFGPMRTFTMVRRHIPHPVVYTMSTHAHFHDGETPHSSPGGLHDDRHGAPCQEPPQIHALDSPVTPADGSDAIVSFFSSLNSIVEQISCWTMF